ncbi:MAG: transposase [Thermoanaerobaculia bacterium]|nr:transposase [Thermoanaerobaculia bacterium]
MVEVTVRTIHSRYLLRPGSELNKVFAGCLGRALEFHPVCLHAVVVMSTHFHLLLSPEDSHQLAGFMGHLNGNLSKKVGRIHSWSGSMFERRYQCIPVSDEPAAQQARLHYLLRHGCKEGLVLNPRDWPGVHSATALCDGVAIEGTWIDRTEYWKAIRRGEDVVVSQFGTGYELQLAPLPCWEHLTEDVWRSFVREMVGEIERETLEEHRRNETVPAGATAVCRRSPHFLPGHRKKSPAPLFHATTRAVWSAMRDAFGVFLISYRDAAERVKSGEGKVVFPPDCFPSRLPFVSPA